MEPSVQVKLPTLNEGTIRALIQAEHGDPFAVLGPHKIKVGGKDRVLVRVLWPGATQIQVVDAKSGELILPLKPVHASGLFEGVLAEGAGLPPYKLKVKEWWGGDLEIEDAYAFGSIVTELDMYLLREGTHFQTYEKLGGHLQEVNGVAGVRFMLWAPNARRVSVVGDFNHWDGRRLPMRFHPGGGLWELFVPGIKPGACYKYEVASRLGGPPALKSDPYGFFFEVRPNTGTVVHDIRGYEWGDGDWIKERAKTNWLEKPVSVYEVHLGSWIRDGADPKRRLNYREIAPMLAEYVKMMGYTHIELMPIAEYPFDGSWGYQPLGHFAPTSRHGVPQDFMWFMDHMHQNEIGVILDWVPAHFPKDAHGLRRFDGTALYEHEDPRKGEHMDWGSLIYNFGRNEVCNFLISSALFWIDKYHIDGLRVDAVASMLYLDYSRKHGEWIPNQYGGNENLEAVAFLKKFNDVVHKEHPGVLTIAEESTAWPGVSRPTYLGGLGFNMKWNMGWMNDTLRYIQRDPVYRKFHHNDLTFSIMYAMSENFVQAFSHDEVVHGKGSLVNKMPGDLWQKCANLRLLMGYMFAHPGKKLNFMGSEFAQIREWAFEQSLDWHLLSHPPHGRMKDYVRDLHKLYRREKAMYEVDYDYSGFQWIDLHDAEASVLGWLRFSKKKEEFVLFVCNFTPHARVGHRVGIPVEGFYEEIFNSDSKYYWGSNSGNDGGLQSEPVPWHDQPHSLPLILPPLGFVAFKLKKPAVVALEPAPVPEGEVPPPPAVTPPPQATATKKAAKPVEAKPVAPPAPAAPAAKPVAPPAPAAKPVAPPAPAGKPADKAPDEKVTKVKQAEPKPPPAKPEDKGPARPTKPGKPGKK